MQQIVSITSQGQLTIPESIRKAFGISESTKVMIKKVGSKIIVEPRNSFWSLAGSLSSGVKLSDSELKKTREEFSKNWSRQ